MIYSTKVRRIRPFRILAFLLTLAVLALSIAIFRIPDVSDELQAARERYAALNEEAKQLRSELELVSQSSYSEKRARSEYGYAYPGEIIYEPVFLDTNGNIVTP